jgi:hypothetical protein
MDFDVAHSTVAKYVVTRRGPPSQAWGDFLRNHAADIAAVDLFVVPTISFGAAVRSDRHPDRPPQSRLGEGRGASRRGLLVN